MAAILSTILFVTLTSVIVIVILIVRQRRRNRAELRQLERDLTDAEAVDDPTPWDLRRRRQGPLWQGANESLSSLRGSAVLPSGAWRGTQSASVSVHDILHRRPVDPSNADFVWMGGNRNRPAKVPHAAEVFARAAESSRRSRAAAPTVRSDVSAASSNSSNRTEVHLQRSFLHRLPRLGHGTRNTARFPYDTDVDIAGDFFYSPPPTAARPEEPRSRSGTHRFTLPEFLTRRHTSRSYAPPVFGDFLPTVNVPTRWRTSGTEPDVGEIGNEANASSSRPDTGLGLTSSSSNESLSSEDSARGLTGRDRERRARVVAEDEVNAIHDSDPLTYHRSEPVCQHLDDN